MQPQHIFSRRIFLGIGLLLVLTAVNVFLFLHLKQGAAAWSFIEKNDGATLFSRVKLLDGGFIELERVYGLAAAHPIQGSSGGGELQVESLAPQQLMITRLSYLDGIRLGASEVKQWGAIDPDSEILRQIILLEQES